MSDSAAIWIAVLPATVSGFFTLVLAIINKNHLHKISKSVVNLEVSTNGKMDKLLESKDAINKLGNEASFAKGKLAGCKEERERE